MPPANQTTGQSVQWEEHSRTFFCSGHGRPVRLYSARTKEWYIFLCTPTWRSFHSLLRPCIFLCTNLWNRIEGSERNLCEVLALCDSLYPYSQGARRHLCTQRSAETSSLQGPVTDFLLTSPLTTSISKKLSSSKQILLFPLESWQKQICKKGN